MKSNKQQRDALAREREAAQKALARLEAGEPASSVKKFFENNAPLYYQKYLEIVRKDYPNDNILILNNNLLYHVHAFYWLRRKDEKLTFSEFCENDRKTTCENISNIRAKLFPTEPEEVEAQRKGILRINWNAWGINWSNFGRLNFVMFVLLLFIGAALSSGLNGAVDNHRQGSVSVQNATDTLQGTNDATPSYTDSSGFDVSGGQSMGSNIVGQLIDGSFRLTLASVQITEVYAGNGDIVLFHAGGDPIDLNRTKVIIDGITPTQHNIIVPLNTTGPQYLFTGDQLIIREGTSGQPVIVNGAPVSVGHSTNNFTLQPGIVKVTLIDTVTNLQISSATHSVS